MVSYQAKDSTGAVDSGQIKVRVHPAVDPLLEVSIDDIAAGQMPTGYASYLYPLTDGNASSFVATRNLGDTNRDGTDDIGFSLSNVKIDGRYYEALVTVFGDPEGELAKTVSVSAVVDGSDQVTGQLLYNKVYELLGPNYQVDLNNDGNRDLVFRHYAGISVYFGQENEPARLDVTDQVVEFRSSGTDVGNLSGIDVQDVNGDNIDDLIVIPDAENLTGQQLRVYYGPISASDTDLFGRTMDKSTGTVISGISPYTLKQKALRYLLADMNGDGKRDLVIGDFTAKNADGKQTGAVYLLWQADDMPTEIDLSKLDTQVSGFATILTLSGESDVSIGSVLKHADVTGDGIQDLVLGLSESSGLLPERTMKAIHVIDGVQQWPTTVNLSDNNTFDQRIIAEGISANLWSVTPTDINGDTYADLVVEYLSTSYILLGGTKLRPSEINLLDTDWPLIKINGTLTTQSIFSMNLNNDEFLDLVITKKSGSEAESFVLYGGLQYNFLH